MKPGTMIALIVSTGVVAASALLLLAPASPLPVNTQVIQVDLPGMGGSGEVTVSWPEEVRAAEPAVIKIEFGLTENCEKEDCSWLTSNQAGLETRIELPGMRTVPEGTLMTALKPGSTIRMEWLVTAYQSGPHTGTVWLYFNQFPAGGKAGEQTVLLAAPIEISARDESIQKTAAWRGIGWAGMFIGCLGVGWTIIRLFWTARK